MLTQSLFRISKNVFVAPIKEKTRPVGSEVIDSVQQNLEGPCIAGRIILANTHYIKGSFPEFSPQGFIDH